MEGRRRRAGEGTRFPDDLAADIQKLTDLSAIGQRLMEEYPLQEIAALMNGELGSEVEFTGEADTLQIARSALGPVTVRYSASDTRGTVEAAFVDADPQIADDCVKAASQVIEALLAFALPRFIPHLVNYAIAETAKAASIRTNSVVTTRRMAFALEMADRATVSRSTRGRGRPAVDKRENILLRWQREAIADRIAHENAETTKQKRDVLIDRNATATEPLTKPEIERMAAAAAEPRPKEKAEQILANRKGIAAATIETRRHPRRQRRKS